MKKITYKTNQNNPEIRAYKAAVEKGKKSQHVLPRNGEWIVKKAGVSSITKKFETQNAAMVFAENIARNQGTAIFIHGRDGRIRDRKDF